MHFLCASVLCAVFVLHRCFILAIFAANSGYMQTKQSSRSNMRFLKGNVLFFALLLLVMMLFTYYAFQGVESGAGNDAACRVSFDAGCTAGEYEVFVDDSLLYKGEPLPADSQVVMKRYAAVNSRVSLYTSKSQIRVVLKGDTVARVLDGNRAFRIEFAENASAISALD